MSWKRRVRDLRETVAGGRTEEGVAVMGVELTWWNRNLVEEEEREEKEEWEEEEVEERG